MTPDRIDVRVVQTMVDAMVGIPQFSYPARQGDNPKPTGEFAHIRLIEEYPESVPKSVIVDQDDDTTTYHQIALARLRFRIGVVDTTGIPSSKIMHGWTSEAMKALMIESGYGFIRCTPLSSEDAKLEKEWEYRKGFSVDFYVTRTYQEIVNNIRRLVVSGEFISDVQISYLLNFDINI